MTLSIEDSAIAMNLAFNIDTGRLPLEFVAKDVAENWQDWKQIIAFWQQHADKSQMLASILKRLRLEIIFTYS